MSEEEEVRPLRLDLDPGDWQAGLSRPLQVRSTAEQLADRLITAIALGGLLPGQKLPPERELAVRMGVSRTTLREATHLLQEMGYLSIRLGRGGGATVNASWGPESAAHIRDVLVPSWRSFEWLFDLAHAIYPITARLAAQRRTAEDIECIAGAVAAYEEATDRDALRRGDHAVHSAIASATDNPHYVSLDNEIRSRLSLGTGALAFSADIRRRALADHRALLQAIEAGDDDVAAEVAHRHHVELAMKPLQELYRRVMNTQ